MSDHSNRDWDEINQAIDHINQKIFQVRKNVVEIKFLYTLLLGISTETINPDEAQRLFNRVEPNVDNELLKKLSDALFEEKTKPANVVVQAIQGLQEGRWGE
ncbi:MAG: hypothetical protein K9L56_15785 [Clostridiales bacterium]|nr:hypothetical protein [Clostridiales bacterium]